MKNEIAFVVMAAGIGSRYNGAKQLETFGRDKLTISEYNVRHAIDSGFRNFYFIINDSVADIFNKRLKTFFPPDCNFGLIYQRPEKDLIKFCNRKKPWGTGHAVLCCDDIVKSNFCVTNADDLYGKDAIFQIAKFLTQQDNNSTVFANVAYHLHATLSDNGTVSRGIIKTSDNLYISEISETHAINSASTSDNQKLKSAFASVNLWGFTPKIFKLLRNGWEEFKTQAKNLETDELYLSSFINSSIQKQQCRVRMLTTSSQWHGITYQRDKESIEQFVDQ